MLVVEGLSKTFVVGSGVYSALRNVSLSIPTGSRVGILGTSGSGKTTLLRCIAGLETPDAGMISLGGRVVFDGNVGQVVDPWARSIGMVFQAFALWPHLSVLENVSFPLRTRARRCSWRAANAKAAQALESVQMGGCLSKLPSELSGGQQQRVALARALVCEPNILLLDEPFSGLDEQLREHVREEMLDLLREVACTVLLVTHDASDAYSVGRRIVVIENGAVAQDASAEEVYCRPASVRVCSLLGSTTVFECSKIETGPDLSRKYYLPGSNQYLTVRGGGIADAATVAIRQSACSLDVGFGSGGKAVLQGIVREWIFMGAHAIAIIEVGLVKLKVRMDSKVRVQVGDRGVVLLDLSGVHIFMR